MSFPRYPTYKPSGVEWLGDMPDHWEARPIKTVARIENSGFYGEDEDVHPLRVPVATTAQIDRDGRFSVEEMPMRSFTNGERNRYGCIPGDILVVKSSGSATNIISGKAGLVREADPLFIFSNFLMRIQADQKASTPAFLYYFITSNITKQRVQLMCSSTTYPNLKVGEYTSACISLPSVNEQVKITSFLDRETTKIDALIAEQQRLIELLQEKRQAVISHAVTKGLNPNAPMKNSGVEWLGEVPEHWAIKKLRYVCKIQTGSRDTEEAIEDGEYPFFVRSQTVERINSYSYDCEAVLTAGDGAGVGKVFHYYTGSFDFHQRVYMLNEFIDIHGKLIYHFLKTNFFKVALQGGAKSTVDSLRRPMFTGFPVCIPPKKEQGPLLEFVEAEEKRIDKLITTSGQAVSLLQERRSALISAAVTGQIDVRGLEQEVAA